MFKNTFHYDKKLTYRYSSTSTKPYINTIIRHSLMLIRLVLNVLFFLNIIIKNEGIYLLHFVHFCLVCNQPGKPCVSDKILYIV